MKLFFFAPDRYLFGMAIWLVSGALSLWLLLRFRRKARDLPGRIRVMNALLSAWLILAVLTLPELYCALFYDQTDSFSLTNTSRRWYQIHVQTNPSGFRDSDPFPNTLPDGMRRICFVGDSFTFGHGIKNIQDRFSDRIAVELKRDQTQKYRVSNLALPGLDTRRLVDDLLYDWIRDKVQIDVMIYTFVLNDIEYFDERTAEFYQRQQQTLPRFFLFRDTYFYNLQYHRLKQFTKSQPSDYYDYLKHSYETEPWQRLVQKFDELQRLCDLNGIELQIVIFPFLHNLGSDYPFRSAHAKLYAHFSSHHIPVLDLEPILAPHVSEGLAVSRFDAHPNERAHELAAEAIRGLLLDNLTRTKE
jgi:lysophospholipase L1-like esterase